MKAFRLILSITGQPASSLHFLDRSDANRYQKILLWPWQNLGYYQSEDGHKFPLEGLQFRVEPVIVPGIYEPELDWIVWNKDGALGFTPLVPGRCFDASSWRAITDQDRRDPVLAPKLAHAQRELEAQEK